MTKTEFLQMVENVVNWVHEEEGRAVCDVTYQPNSGWFETYIIIRGKEGIMTVRSPSDIIDIPAYKRAQKMADLERLKKELGE